MIKNKAIILILTIMSITLIGCVETQRIYETSKDVTINNFKSEQEFKEFLNENKNNYGYYGGALRGSTMMAFDMVADGAVPESTLATKTISLDYSETNVQVQGVDELDIIKTDGNYIYTSTNQDLFIIKAYPAEEAEIISTINLKNQITGLFIEENILAVTGTIRNIDELKEIGLSTYTGLTFLNMYDVSDKKNPELIKEYKFDGSYFNARLFEGIIYLSTNFNPYNRPSPMPIIITDGVTRTTPITDIYFYNTDYSSAAFVSIHSINMKNQEKIDSKIMTLEGNNHMYMSYENIYLTYQENINQYELQQEIMMNKIIPKLSKQDKDYIQRIKEVDNDLMNKYEKQSKIMEVIQRYVEFLDIKERDELQEQIELEVKEELKKLKYLEYTVIHKISVDKGKLNFEAGNKVPGNVYGQFALDEHKGILRVTTTLRQGMTVTDEYDLFNWQKRSPSTNNVYIK